MSTPGYYRFPTLHSDRLVFVSDDDLWAVSTSGGRAERLTDGLGPVSRPRFSPDGQQLAFTGAEEGRAEVYVMRAGGGPLRRLTWVGDARVAGWTPDGRVVFVTSAGRPHARDAHLWAVPTDGGPAEPLGLGHGVGLAYGPHGQVALCRHQEDLAAWRGYRGGRMGVIWLREGGAFAPLSLPGNVAAPLWVEDRLWFLSDAAETGVAPAEALHINLWSVQPGAERPSESLRRHTAHRDHAVRWPSTDGRRITYSAGGALWIHTPGQGCERIEPQFPSPRTARQRRFVPPAAHLHSVDLHPEGHSLGLISRGQAVALGHWEGPVRRIGPATWEDETGKAIARRYRLLRWLGCGQRIALISDQDGEEAFEIHPLRPDGGGVRRYEGLDIGRPLQVEISPTDRHVAFTTHRHQLGILELSSGTLTWLDQGEAGRFSAPAWSPCGTWLAWCRPEGARGATSRLRLHHIDAGTTIDLTDGRYRDTAPAFDPEGELLYLLSHREFEPVYDNIYFDLGFPRGVRPYAFTLRADQPHPFRPRPRALRRSGPPSRPQTGPLPIDLPGIADRIVRVPVPEARYLRVEPLSSGRLLLQQAPVKSGLSRRWYSAGPPAADHSLALWDPHRRELIPVARRLTSFRLDRKRQTLALRIGARLRVIPAAPDKGRREELSRAEREAPSRKSGWIDLNRLAIEVDPLAEWRQITAEAWRLMRDHFWTEDMGGVDWAEVRSRYAPLVERISTRRELSDLLAALQGELGTSHAYVMGGAPTQAPLYRTGALGADFRWDPAREAWVFTRIWKGEPGDPSTQGPLSEPGIRLRPGAILRAIDGLAVDQAHPPAARLVKRANTLVTLTIEDDRGTREITARTVSDDRPIRYREWVLSRRKKVHEASEGRVGYVHIPNMGPTGYATFHRDYLSESSREALVVDVRYNGGGHVSQMLFARLARRPAGFSVTRWEGAVPYPAHTVRGPMVCLANEFTGSDGDIFSHVWKMYGLGPLIGTRTWGGVVGIWPRHPLIDRAVTTQPEYAYWFEDVAWDLENTGAQPDIEVPLSPEDAAADQDPQLQRAIDEALAELHRSPPPPPPVRGRSGG